TLEGLLADDMLHPAGVPFRRFRVYAGLDQPVGKEAVLFVDLLRHFPTHIGQMQEIVAVHCQEAPFPQGRHRMADAGLCDLQVPGHIYGAHHAFLLFEHQNGLQIIFARRIERLFSSILHASLQPSACSRISMNRRYSPPWVISSAWVPRWTMRPSSTTRI